MKNKTNRYSGEQVAVAFSALMAVFLAYLTFPSLVSGLLGQEFADAIWESPLSFMQAITIISALAMIGISLSIANKANQVKKNGGADISFWLIVAVFSIVSIVMTMIVFVFAFGISTSVFLSLGIESIIAGTIGLVMAFVAVYLLK